MVDEGRKGGPIKYQKYLKEISMIEEEKRDIQGLIQRIGLLPPSQTEQVVVHTITF